MCGIAGFSLNPSDNVDARELTRALATQIVSRGRDATGIAWFAGDTVEVRKAPVGAWKFVDSGKGALQGLDGLADLPTDAKTVIIHTRAATQGSPADPGNNHPIVQGPIVGVHNGVLYNDDAIFEALMVPRNAEVDSEAAFALIRESADPAYSLDLLEGFWALAWMDARQGGRLHLVRGQSSPVQVRGTTTGSFVFASEARHVDTALRDLHLDPAWSLSLDENSYMTVNGGVVTSFLEITQWPTSSWKQANGTWQESGQARAELIQAVVAMEQEELSIPSTAGVVEKTRNDDLADSIRTAALGQLT